MPNFDKPHTSLDHPPGEECDRCSGDRTPTHYAAFNEWGAEVFRIDLETARAIIRLDAESGMPGKRVEVPDGNGWAVVVDFFRTHRASDLPTELHAYGPMTGNYVRTYYLAPAECRHVANITTA